MNEINHERKGFFLFYEMVKSLDCLTDEQLGSIIRQAMEYCDSKTVPQFEDKALEMAFFSVKLWVDLDHERYENIVKKRSLAGKKGAYVRWNKEETIKTEAV